MYIYFLGGRSALLVTMQHGATVHVYIHVLRSMPSFDYRVVENGVRVKDWALIRVVQSALVSYNHVFTNVGCLASWWFSYPGLPLLHWLI